MLEAGAMSSGYLRDPIVDGVLGFVGGHRGGDVDEAGGVVVEVAQR